MLTNALFRFTAMTVCLLHAGSAMAAPAELQLRWVDLAGRIGGRQISLDLSDGSHFKGHVIAVRADSLEMEVSGNKRSIPRASVRRLTLEKKVKNTKLMGAGIGGGIVVGSAGAGYATQDYAGVAVALIGAAIGVGVIVASLFVGHTARTTTIPITIID
jgi:hypothetical protein